MDDGETWIEEWDDFDSDIHPFWKMTVVSAFIFFVAVAIVAPIAALIWLLSFLCP